MQSLVGKDEEIVITSIIDAQDGLVMTGSVKNDNYRVLVLKVDKNGELEWRKTYGQNSVDYEGQNIVTIDDGFLICGCSEGHASEDGGRDWKAYVLRLNSNGEEMWERSFRVKGNECAYSLVANQDILLFGETRDMSGNAHFFLLKLTNKGEEIWREIYCIAEDVVAGGLVPLDQDYLLVGSLTRNGKWHLHLLGVNGDGSKIWERSHKDALVYDIINGEDRLFLTGMKGERVYLARISEDGEMVWERTYDNGCGVSIDCKKDKIIIAGEIEAGESYLPVLYGISEDGAVEWKRVFDGEGFIEKVKQLDDGFVLFRHGLTPREHTEIILVDGDGLDQTM
ncbi:MAG: hypothetical protein JSV43_00060 [Methanobacteriota archaeon]|nr:MAG: hypothetical protein JSV43_00060 [Euryarchaeota archaeon]